jgi:hypothetical protein
MSEQSRLKELPEQDQAEITHLSVQVMEHVYILISKLRDVDLPIDDFEIYHNGIRVKLWDPDPNSLAPEYQMNNERYMELPESVTKNQ